MANENGDPRRPDEAHDGSASGGTGAERAPAPERDLGDSAGYGTGGSALDYHDVGDEGADPVKGKHNPLDDVMKTDEDGSPSGSPGGS